MASQVLKATKSVGLVSTAFAHGKEIPREFTCQGADTSPALTITNVPPATRALALVMDDPDAPGGTFTHWTWWDLPPTATRISKGADIRSMGGVEGGTDFGGTGYGGPCPPDGEHRYFFRVFALSAKLGLSHGAPVEDVWRALEGRVVAWGELMGTYAQS